MIFIPFTLHKDIKNIFTKKTKQNSPVSVFLINFKDTNNFGGQCTIRLLGICFCVSIKKSLVTELKVTFDESTDSPLGLQMSNL